MSNNNPKNGPAKSVPAQSAAKPVTTPIPAGKGTAPSTAPTSSVPKPIVPVHVPPLFRRIDWISFGITFFLTLVGYLYTLAPDLTLEDCGELATGSYYAGVPHPPGYPVWTVYTWVFTWLVPIGNIAYRVAISSAFAGALACGLVALMVSRGSSMILEGIADLKNIEKRWENPLCLVCGFVAGMVIGFNGFMWSQAVIVEVYTLSALSMTGVLCCLLRWIYAPHQRRYLYMAFFWFGICFNNHQSLLVISIGMEAAVLCAAPRLARTMLLSNWLIWLFGLWFKSMGMIGMLNGSGNPGDPNMVLFIFNLVGVGSFLIWVVLLVTTRVRGLELARDLLMGLGLFYLATFFLVKAGQITYFEFKKPVYILFNMGGIATLGAACYLAVLTWKTGREWLATVWCGGAFIVGAAFYLYMPVASMSNPPLNWGYPRTVAGFYHAFGRGQYEKIHPTEQGKRYVEQVKLYIGGLFEEMNFVYVLIALIPLFYLRRMQARERAWIIGLAVTYFTLSAFLLWLLNPAPDRQSRDLNRVFFTASHFMVAMAMGYGLAILGGYIVTQWQRFRIYCLAGTIGASVFALFMIAVRYYGFELHSLIIDMDPSYSPIVRFTCWFSLAVALAGVIIFVRAREQVSRTALLSLMCVLPLWSILSHWYDNEQRGHYFGYWFGHDMFTPPFNDPKTNKPLYPEMDRDTVLYGGTDPGRFNPTYMIFCESFIPPSKRNPQDPNFDRRDVYLITQNALADGTYLNYIRAHYNRSAQIDPPFFSEIVRGQHEVETGDKTNLLARTLRPIDHLFIGLGDKIEEKRRAGSSVFRAEDFTDLPGLTARLKSAKEPLSKFIFDNLSKETQQLVSSGGNDSSTRRGLARDLTTLIRREMDAWKELEEKLDQQNGYTNAIANAQSEVAGLSGDKQEKTRAKVAAKIEGYKAALVPIEKAIAELRAVPSLYDPHRFEGITLSSRTQRFAKQDPRSHTRIRLNRILLEEAFPKEIAKSQGGVYPDLEILTASNDDSQRCFSEYLADANRRLQHDRDHPNEPRQIKPGEDVKVIDNKVQVSGQVAVMSINGLLTKVIFDKNPDHEFYVEESFPLDWMYPHLTPYGIIMKINRQPVPELTEDMLYRDHEFWSQFSKRSIGNWITYDTTVSNICDFAEEAYYKRRVPKGFSGDRAFLRDSDGQKAFSKLRSSIAGVYTWRLGEAQKKGNGIEFQRMVKEADFAFKQAYAFCPYSPEAIFRYVNLLVQMGRVDDALLLANTSLKLDPFNGQIDNLLVELNRIKNSMPRNTPPPAAAIPPVPQEQLNALEAQFKAQPSNVALAFQYIAACIQSQQGPKALEALDQVVAQPTSDPNTLLLAADGYAQMGHVAKVEQTLQHLVQSAPENPEGRFQLAAFQAMQNKPAQAIESLSNSLRLSAARLAKDPNAQNLYAAATADTRLASLRSKPECQQLLDSFRPKVEATKP